MGKREESLTVRLSEAECARIREFAALWDKDISDILRLCVTLAIPQLKDISFLLRVQMQDNRDFHGIQ